MQRGRHGIIAGDHILRQSEVGLASGANPAIGPGQPRGPLDRVVAIGDLLKDRVVLTFGFEAAATVLHDRDIAIARERDSSAPLGSSVPFLL